MEVLSDYRNLYLCAYGNSKRYPATSSERAEQKSKIMSTVFLLGGILIIYLAYYFGKKDGVVITNKKLLRPGVWITFNSHITIPKGNVKSVEMIRSGTMAIVTSIDRRGRYSIWIAKPWLKLYGEKPEYHDLYDYYNIQINNEREIDPRIVQQTINDIDIVKKDRKALWDHISPPE